jgi:hypothetical protein
MFPEGRIGTRRFLSITGLSKTRFFTEYRHAPKWIREFDIRFDASERLSFDEAAAHRFAAANMGSRVRGISARSNRLRRACPCGEQVAARARFCSMCGQSLSGATT